MHTHFCRFGVDMYAIYMSVLSNKISPSELSRKFVKSALLVGYLVHIPVVRRGNKEYQVASQFLNVLCPKFQTKAGKQINR